MRLDAPAPRALRVVRWRALPGDAGIEEHVGDDRWVKGPAWHGDVLDGLAGGEDHHALLARFVKRHPDEKRAKWADHLVRRYLLRLHERGDVDLGLPAAPAVFHERFATVKLLGRGGFGVAWLARDTQRGGEPVVVKHAWSYLNPLEVGERALRTEERVMRAADHGGVARLVDSFEQDGRWHIAREYVDGIDLVNEAGSPPQHVARAGLEVARILQHLHERGFLMLDVGAKNFMRRHRDGAIVATDLGLAAEHEGGERKLVNVVGNRGYTSPEMLTRMTASVRSDVYSLGRLLFMLATRSAPRDKWSDADLEARLEDGPLKDVVLRMTQKEPAARPADMRQVAALLEEAARRAA